MKKKITLVVSLLLVMALSIGGTIAWLTDTSDTVINTFTVGNVKIKLEETDADEDGNLLTNSYKMIPGSDIAKDPTITVEAGSENCWVFVKVKGNESYADYLTHEMADGWTLVAGETDVYVYAKEGSNSIAAETEIEVLKNDQVTVKGNVTQDMMDKITDKKTAEPTLTITAYAIQSANLKNADDTDADTAAEAWALVKPAS